MGKFNLVSVKNKRNIEYRSLRETSALREGQVHFKCFPRRSSRIKRHADSRSFALRKSTGKCGRIPTDPTVVDGLTYRLHHPTREQECPKSNKASTEELE